MTGQMGVRAVPLDPQLQAIRDQRERDNAPPLYAMSLTEARAADLASIRQSGGQPEPVYEVANLTITGPGGELPLRLYRPTSERPLPTLLYFFGGGWVLGTIDTADGISRSLANSSGALVVVVGYRLAPEHPFPAAIDDCYATVRWVLTDEAVRAADVVVTMGCGDACPVFPGKRYLDWDLPDASGASVEEVRPIRDEI